MCSKEAQELFFELGVKWRSQINREEAAYVNEFCEDRSYMKLAVLSEMSAPTMKKILIGQLDCSDDQWARILNAFELMT